MKIVLTGAGGFIGGHLLAQLKQAGHFVRAVTRTDRGALQLADEVTIEKLSPRSDFEALLIGAEILIHLADGFNSYELLPHTKSHPEAEERLQTVLDLAQVAARKNVRFIYLSTIKTMCGTYASARLDEQSPTEPQSLYGRLKLEAEQGILQAAQAQGSAAVIVRFPVVFGAGVGGNMQKLLALADSPLPLPFGGLDNRRSLISSHSLIDAVMRVVAFENRQQGIFLVQDEAISSARLMALLRDGLGRPQRLVKMPALVWPYLSRLPGIGAKLDRFTRSLELDDRKFRAVFDWQPPETLAHQLRLFARTERQR
ncbi:MAG: NAD-dependent epimerase/dehydratase family protein [Hyphomicrobiaceae bacterium]|nr:NAD-dependent epimerase/dehydratase family protein [Hyphomicrobiaceae bacterium]